MNKFQRQLVDAVGNKEKGMNKLEREAAEGWGWINATVMIFLVYLVVSLFDTPVNTGTFIVPLFIGLYKILHRKYKLEVKLINIKKFNDTTEAGPVPGGWKRVEGRRGEL